MDDFIKYAKEEFGIDIVIKQDENSDTFENIFSGSFLNDFIKDMRNPTLEELQGVQKYIDTISRPTGVNFNDLLNVESSTCDNCTNNPKNDGSGIFSNTGNLLERSL